MHLLHMTADFNKFRGEGFCRSKESDRRSLDRWFRIWAPAVIGANGELSTMCQGLPSVRYNEVFMLQVATLNNVTNNPMALVDQVNNCRSRSRLKEDGAVVAKKFEI
jgi:hypothetical protein